MEEMVKKEVEQALQSAISALYNSLEIKTGEISPLQQFELDIYIGEISSLFIQLINQNRGITGND